MGGGGGDCAENHLGFLTLDHQQPPISPAGAMRSHLIFPLNISGTRCPCFRTTDTVRVAASPFLYALSIFSPNDQPKEQIQPYRLWLNPQWFPGALRIKFKRPISAFTALYPLTPGNLPAFPFFQPLHPPCVPGSRTHFLIVPGSWLTSRL